jgi:hypothetical protein
MFGRYIGLSGRGQDRHGQSGLQSHALRLAPAERNVRLTAKAKPKGRPGGRQEATTPETCGLNGTPADTARLRPPHVPEMTASSRCPVVVVGHGRAAASTSSAIPAAGSGSSRRRSAPRHGPGG